MVKNFSNYVKGINLYIEEVQNTLPPPCKDIFNENHI
jgi:hypothetical protein